jgi:hypothetical protein
LLQRIPDYPIGIISSGENQNVGHLGLATDSTFLQQAADASLIGQNQIGFGLDVGSQSIANPRAGTLVLGGYDQASYKDTFFNFTIGDINSSERQCPLQITITRLAIRFPQNVNYTDVLITSGGVFVPACIEP